MIDVVIAWWRRRREAESDDAEGHAFRRSGADAESAEGDVSGHVWIDGVRSRCRTGFMVRPLHWIDGGDRA